MSTYINLLNTVGPFLLFSNTWSSLRVLLRSTKKSKNKSKDKSKISSRKQLPSGLYPALAIFLERALRFSAVIIGLRLTNSVISKQSKLIQKIATFISASILHSIFVPYHWTLSLYFLCRSTGLLLVRNKKLTDRSGPVALVRHPICIFILHCFHNYFLTHRADIVSPSYLKLWLQVLPIQYKKLDAWLQDFSTKSCATKYYDSIQCGASRLALLPKRMIVSLKRQLPLVATTFVLPIILFKRQKLMKAPIPLLWDTVIKTVRSSLVLTALPFLLTEFPCFWGLATGQPSNKTIRTPMLHTISVSLLSTFTVRFKKSNLFYLSL